MGNDKKPENTRQQRPRSSSVGESSAPSSAPLYGIPPGRPTAVQRVQEEQHLASKLQAASEFKNRVIDFAVDAGFNLLSGGIAGALAPTPAAPVAVAIPFIVDDILKPSLKPVTDAAKEATNFKMPPTFIRGTTETYLPGEAPLGTLSKMDYAKFVDAMQDDKPPDNVSINSHHRLLPIPKNTKEQNLARTNLYKYGLTPEASQAAVAQRTDQELREMNQQLLAIRKAQEEYLAGQQRSDALQTLSKGNQWIAEFAQRTKCKELSAVSKGIQIGVLGCELYDIFKKGEKLGDAITAGKAMLAASTALGGIGIALGVVSLMMSFFGSSEPDPMQEYLKQNFEQINKKLDAILENQAKMFDFLVDFREEQKKQFEHLSHQVNCLGLTLGGKIDALRVNMDQEFRKMEGRLDDIAKNAHLTSKALYLQPIRELCQRAVHVQLSDVNEAMAISARLMSSLSLTDRGCKRKPPEFLTIV